MDFIIKARGEKFKILQIPDMQIIDTKQCGRPDRLCAAEQEKWIPEKMKENAFDMMDELDGAFSPILSS